jgi:hypothetical protein
MQVAVAGGHAFTLLEGHSDLHRPIDRADVFSGEMQRVEFGSNACWGHNQEWSAAEAGQRCRRGSTTSDPIGCAESPFPARPAVSLTPHSRAAASNAQILRIGSGRRTFPDEQRWRVVNAPHLVALVRAGARFERGQPVERPKAHAA